MRLCIARRSHLYRAKFILQLFTNERSIRFTETGNDAGSVLMGKESNMINKLLGAAAMAAVAYAVVPASAAKMAGCSGENLSKTESMIDAMADGEGKITAQKEVALAQTAMLDGKLGACSAHLTKAMHVGTAK
jgi:hypothetical protein